MGSQPMVLWAYFWLCRYSGRMVPGRTLGPNGALGLKSGLTPRKASAFVRFLQSLNIPFSAILNGSLSVFFNISGKFALPLGGDRESDFQFLQGCVSVLVDLRTSAPDPALGRVYKAVSLHFIPS